MNAVELMFTGNAAGAVAAADETKAAVASVGTTSRGTTGEVGKLERGVLAGSGAFRGLGRSVAFASGAFLLAGGFADAIKGSVDQAEKLEKAQKSLDAAIEHTGGNVKTQRAAYDATAKAAAQYGISQADATQELSRALLLTGDQTKAQRSYEQALLISKATGKDFNSVLTATAKAQDGSSTSLTRYGIMLPKVTTAQDALKKSNANATAAQINAAKAVDANTQAMETSRVIMQRFGGQAAANTTNMDRLRANAANLGAELGGPLLSALNLVAGSLSGLIGWLQKNQAILKPIAEFIGIVTAAWGGYLAVTEGIPAVLAAVRGAMIAVDAAMAANPIGLVVIALAALVAGFIVAWQHSRTFRDIVLGTWNAIKAATVAVVDFVKEHWRAGVVALAAIIFGPIAAIAVFIATHWNQVRSITLSVWNAVRNGVATAVHAVQNVVSAVFGKLADIVHGAASAIRSAAGAIRSAFQPVLNVLNAIISIAERAVGAIERVISAGHKAGGAIKGAASSAANAVTGGLFGVVTGHAAGISYYPGGWSIVGENGPELVTLPRGSSILSNSQTRAALAGRSGTAGGALQGGPAITYVINANVLGTTDRQVAQGLAQIVRAAPRSPVMRVVAR